MTTPRRRGLLAFWPLALLAGVGAGLWASFGSHRSAAVRSPPKPRPSASAIARAPVVPSASVAPSAPPLVAEQRYPGLDSELLDVRNAALIAEMAHELRLSDAQVARVKAVFESSKWLGQGNPEVTQAPDDARGVPRNPRQSASATRGGCAL